MLEFYEFNNLNIFIVLVSTFIIYNLLCNKNKTKKNELNIKNLIVSSVISLGISAIVSYILAVKDETLLTENYWDSNLMSL